MIWSLLASLFHSWAPAPCSPCLRHTDLLLFPLILPTRFSTITVSSAQKVLLLHIKISANKRHFLRLCPTNFPSSTTLHHVDIPMEPSYGPHQGSNSLVYWLVVSSHWRQNENICPHEDRNFAALQDPDHILAEMMTSCPQMIWMNEWIDQTTEEDYSSCKCWLLCSTIGSSDG
jgi:hypothetical protein